MAGTIVRSFQVARSLRLMSTIISKYHINFSLKFRYAARKLWAMDYETDFISLKISNIWAKGKFFLDIHKNPMYNCVR